MPKENTETVNPLMEKFSQTLAAAQSLEKQANKIYQKFIKASHTPELAKCLSPGSADSDKHLQRIKLIQTSLGTKLSPSKKMTCSLIQSSKKFRPNRIWISFPRR